MKRPLVVVVCCVALVLTVFVWRWHYRECRTVGHSVTYCVVDK